MMRQPGFEPARLRLARELKERSQADLASRISVTAAALGQYESGATRPSPQVFAELSRVLDVPAEFFALSVVETHEGFFRSTRRTPGGAPPPCPGTGPHRPRPWPPGRRGRSPAPGLAARAATTRARHPPRADRGPRPARPARMEDPRRAHPGRPADR